MQCHYEVLEVSRDASSEDLKKSYRKLVLQWHPDKNLNNAQECKEKFQLIQQAYDILSDPQERAWYDKHREDILKGGENFKDDSLNVFQYFRTSCYTGYGDDEKGFFSTYREVFEKIATEDTPFMDQEELLPSFGCSTSPYDEVVHLFYSYWQSYCTAKTYVWIEAYDIREAPNRRVLRLMEKENKKLRDVAKKARNEEIRELVSFVRKRDPRVQAQKKKLEEKKAENVRKAQVQRQKAILERKKELSNYNECEWSNMSRLEANLQEIEAQLDNQFGRDSDPDTESDDIGGTNGDVEPGDESEAEDDGLYCIACDKIFQSERAKLNHDKSKKHRENVALLKAALEEDQNNLLADSDDLDKQKDAVDENIESDHEDVLQARISVSGSDSDADESCLKVKQSRNTRKKKKTVVIQQEAESENEGELLDLGMLGKEPQADKEDMDEDLASSTDVKTKKKRRRTKPSSGTVVAAPEPVVEPDDSETKPQKIMCGTCRSEFSSRNKLFNHLKSTNHSVFLEDKPKVATASDKQSKRKKGRTKQRE